MIKNTLAYSIVIAAAFLGANPSLALDFSSVQTINPNQAQESSEVVINLNKDQQEPKVIKLNASETLFSFSDATDKFVQCNVRASWEYFQKIIESAEANDFIYMSTAGKMSDMGFFDLATLALNKLQDKEITNLPTEEMKRYYFPRKRLKLDDELLLAETYSNIMFNDQSSEAVNELSKNKDLLSTSDYANYLMALGYYKSGVTTKAQQYIDIATLQNANNLNYQTLKAKITADGKTPTDALKIIDNLKKQNLSSAEYKRKINSTIQYVLYKNSKTEWQKNYHLGYYFHFENDDSKAIRTLQTALSCKKGSNALVFGLMSEIYLNMFEFEKALDCAKKALRHDSNNPKALITMGDLNLRTKEYKQALKYYKEASSKDKNNYIPQVKEAQVLALLSNTKKAKELYQKVLKSHSDSFEAYYNIALLEPDKKEIYLKKTLAINPLFKDAWIELAKMAVEKDDFEKAIIYLSNAYYIDENDFRYYYYQGLANKGLGDFTQAAYNFKKCLKLNPKFDLAQKELNGDNCIDVNNIKEIKIK